MHGQFVGGLFMQILRQDVHVQAQLLLADHNV